MFGIAAVVAFAIALIFDLTSYHSGHWTPTTFAHLGLLLLAVHVIRPVWPRNTP